MAAPKEFAASGSITDVKKNPIEGAKVTLHSWDGVMSPALQTTTTDTNGHFEFLPLPDNTYYYVAIRKETYAVILQLVNPGVPVKAALRPAVNSWVDVRSAAGDPLKGARLTSISIRTEENAEEYVSLGMAHLFGLKFTESDEAGQLKLPPLPEGALVDILIDHPEWAQGRRRKVRVTKGRLSEISMSAGVKTAFQFVADPRTPMVLDGLTVETSLWSITSDSAASIKSTPMTITWDQIRLCPHPGKYDIFNLRRPGLAITPVLEKLTFTPEGERKLRLLVRKTVNVSGRVVREDGTPHAGVEVLGQIENLSPDGLIPGENEWIYNTLVETDADGKFTIALPPGRSRVEVGATSFYTDRDSTDVEVRVDGPNAIPDIVTRPIPLVRGLIVDDKDRPVSAAIVRIRIPGMLGESVVSDVDGKFELSLPWISRDPDTQQRQYDLNVVAFVTDQPLMGFTRIDLRETDTLKALKIVLQPDPSEDALLSMKDNKWVQRIRQKAALEKTDEEKHPAGKRGQAAPELDGAAWFNTDARSLKDFRGRYVLLDFWFIGCGPCHGDLPSVKLVHERFEKLGVTVVGVHNDSSSPEAVLEHCKKHEMKFPIVVDHADGRILEAYRQLGVRGFPSYILIGPDGNILENDFASTNGNSLRGLKLEVVRKYVLGQRK